MKKHTSFFLLNCLGLFYNPISAQYSTSLFPNSTLAKANSEHDIRSSFSLSSFGNDSFFLKKKVTYFFDTKLSYGTSGCKQFLSPFEYSSSGGQIQLSGGFFLKKKNFSFAILPVVQSAEKKYYSNFLLSQNTFAIDRYYNLFVNWIDSEDFYSREKLIRVFPGMTFVAYDIKNIRIKLSTENNKWGPGKIHNLILSDNTSGYPHFSIESKKKLFPKFISLDFQVISGFLNTLNNDRIDTNFTINGNKLYRNKSTANRILNAFTISATPKFLKGITLGFTRSSMEYSYNKSIGVNLTQLIPFFKQNLIGEDSISRDQYASFFFKINLDSSKFQIYSEIGKNDFAYNFRDFIMSPFHSGGLVLGLSKSLSYKSHRDIFTIEYVSTSLTESNTIRDEPMWYSHYRVRQGYTNYSKVLGAYVGGGAKAFSFRWTRVSNNYFFNIAYDYTINNIDMAKYMFGENAKNWTTNSVLVTFKKLHNNNLPIFQFGLSYHKNYQWNSYNPFKVRENLLIPYFSISKNF